MQTPRAESIQKSLHAHTAISSLESNEAAHKIDRFAVISQIIEPGVQELLATPVFYSLLDSAESKRELHTRMQNCLYESILYSLHSSPFADHLASLNESQVERYKANKSWSPEPKDSVLAGVSTFMSTFENVFDIFERAYGTEFAAHSDHWKISDKIAKLNVLHSSLYSSTFLHNSQNWTKTIDHFELDLNGNGMKFKAGYPLAAKVPVALTASKNALLTRDDFTITKNSNLVHISDIPADGVTVGCPITFTNATLKDLWSVYGEARQQFNPYKV